MVLDAKEHLDAHFEAKKYSRTDLEDTVMYCSVLVHHSGALYWFIVELIQNSAVASLITKPIYCTSLSPLKCEHVSRKK